MASMSDNAARNESRPLPDPTVLTTQQLDKAVTCLREVIEARLDGMDTAIQLLQTGTDRLPAFVKCEVKQLQDLHEEKFKSIGTQFSERDNREQTTSSDRKIAIDAALKAAKEAVEEQNKSNAASITKSEAGFTKQIDAIGILIQTTAKATDEKIDDVKTRLTSIESHSKGVGDVWGFVVGAAGLMIAVVTVIVMLMRN